jgi:peptide-methionine (S)-S-oxide reductase
MKLKALSLLSAVFFMACSTAGSEQPEQMTANVDQQDLSSYSVAYLAAGCFWCVEAVFESVRGVEEAISGYAGGDTPDPTYKSIGTGTTGHAEAVAVYYDPAVVSFKELLVVFFDSQDPTTPNRQGPDRGSQYRSIAFYQNAEEKQAIESYIAELDASGKFSAPIVTEVTEFSKFYPAEDYHQNYERLNPDNPYVRNVSIPRLRKFQAKHPELLK